MQQCFDMPFSLLEGVQLAVKNTRTEKEETRLMIETNTPNVDVQFAWRILDDVLRGTFKHHETGQILLPFVVLRRFGLHGAVHA